MCSSIKALTAGILVSCVFSAASAEVSLTLTTDFIVKYKNRVTIDSDVTPVFFSQVHQRGATGDKDGDIHVAVLPGSEIGLSTVIELQNARDVRAAIDMLQQARQNNAAIKVTGVWRIWAEHGGEFRYIQGAPIPRYPHSNPDHVFEIHPITQVGNMSTLASLAPIEGFTAPDQRAADAFHAYERIRSEIHPHKKSEPITDNSNHSILMPSDYATVRLQMAGFNYVKFLMRLTDKRGFEVEDGVWAQPEDGMFVFAEIYDPDDDEEPLVQKRRLGFVRDSEPFRKVSGMNVGDCMLVLGIPRLNLELIAWRLGLGVRQPHSNEVLSWNLPYEMVVAAIYDDQPRSCGPGAH
jgi:hypothetical protein